MSCDVELVGDIGVAVGGGVVLARLRVGASESVCVSSSASRFQGVQVVEDGQALVEDGLAAQREAILREVAEGHALDAGELAVVEGLKAGEDLEQGGFAGAVAADKAGALVRRDQPVDVFKEEFLAEALAGGGELEHLLLFSHLKDDRGFWDWGGLERLRLNTDYTDRHRLESARPRIARKRRNNDKGDKG